LVGAGARSAPTVFIHPLEVEFGWSRAETAFAVSIKLFLYGLAGALSCRLKMARAYLCAAGALAPAPARLTK